MMTAGMTGVAKTTVRENRVHVPGVLGPGNGDGGCSDVPSSSYLCVWLLSAKLLYILYPFSVNLPE